MLTVDIEIPNNLSELNIPPLVVKFFGLPCFDKTWPKKPWESAGKDTVAIDEVGPGSKKCYHRLK